MEFCVGRQVWSFRVLCVGDKCVISDYFVWGDRRCVSVYCVWGDSFGVVGHFVYEDMCVDIGNCFFFRFLWNFSVMCVGSKLCICRIL